MYSCVILSLLSKILNIHGRVVGLCLHVLLHVCMGVFSSFSRSANSVALTAARGFGVAPPRSSGQPGGDGVRGGLLGHAVVADHRVETTPRVGILGGVVGLEGGWDAALVLQGDNSQI